MATARANWVTPEGTLEAVATYPKYWPRFDLKSLTKAVTNSICRASREAPKARATKADAERIWVDFIRENWRTMADPAPAQSSTLGIYSRNLG